MASRTTRAGSSNGNERLDQILDLLNQQSARMNEIEQEVHYLGHVIFAEGISVDLAKIEALVDWPTTQNVSEVWSFMGLAGYYRNYVEGFSMIAAPITSLQKKEKRFECTKKCEESFQLLKQKLTTAPVLTIPDPNGHFIVITDALGEGMGVVLMQEGKVVAFES
ncbi:uncharacterized mitochondrial protein AtMg00860-like [Cryptomeria japonica]|uniref:uncharacterized mitochondrial protein AtMg00860-like n=1 Tax=Cryptomeria japonica TaxID=3369 RepID=UPI0027DA5F6E|nr:uncharacterized mitochondrial protein AtMg00860-like [Cryptomeria japonica]